MADEEALEKIETRAFALIEKVGIEFLKTRRAGTLAYGGRR